MCIGVGGFLNACSHEPFRESVRRFLVYDPACIRTPAPAAVFRSLMLVVLALVLIALLGQYLKYVLELSDTRLGLMLYIHFNLDQEHWVPTTFSFAILLYSGLLLANIARRKALHGGRFVVHWALLSLAFVYLGIDEKFRIHERAFDFLRPVIDANVPVFWVVPAGVLTIVGVLAYLRFVFHLPLVYCLLFICSGSVYLTGAIGLEIIGRTYALDHGIHNLRDELLADTEELFEMLGIVIFIYSLQSYLQHMAEPRVRSAPSRSRTRERRPGGCD